jgi:hypothetical protein
VSLAEALELTLLLAEGEPQKYDRPAHGLLDLFGEAWMQTMSSRSSPT